MNIFSNPQDFIGELNTEHIGTVKEVLLKAQKIRLLLGDRAYLLDTYLYTFFESCDCSDTSNMADTGFSIGSDLKSICNSISYKNDENREHPFYARAVEIFNACPNIYSYRGSEKCCYLLFIALIDDFVIYAVECFCEERKTALKSILDEVQLCELYDSISLIVGEEYIESLNLLLKHRFLTIPHMGAFSQGLTDFLFGTLLTEDIETNKRMFQIALDTLC